MHVCIRAYSSIGLIAEMCKYLVSEYNTYETAVYDLDANSDSWGKINTVPFYFQLINYGYTEILLMNLLKFQIQECISIPVHAFKQMHVCIRAYSSIGLIAEMCKYLRQVSEYNTYETAVYDLDANSDSWGKINTVPFYFQLINYG